MPNPFRSREVELPNAIVGAARRVRLNRKHDVEKLREAPVAAWQKLAWRYYDEIGEVKFAFNYFASLASRVRLFPAYQGDEDESPFSINEAAGVSPELKAAARASMERLNRGRGGQPNLIRALALNLLVAGEGYLVEFGDTFSIRSTSELEVTADERVRLVSSASQRGTRHSVYLPPDAYMLRIWRTHPQYSDDADSSLRGVLKECGELMLLDRLIATSVGSRMNAGIMYVADELRFQRADGTDPVATPDVDPFEEELTFSLSEAIDDPDAHSSIVPLIIRGPADLADKAIKQFDLSRSFDETIIKRHEKTLNRVINGLDIPRDILEGYSETRYSNAQTISEDMLKAYIEPLILVIAEALAVGYLRADLKSQGFRDEEVKRIHVWYDASEVVTRPDRSEPANQGYDRRTISAAAWRKAHGFTEADAPSDEEIAYRVALEGQVTADITLEYLRMVAPDLVAAAEAVADSQGAPTATGTPERPSDYVPEATPPRATPRPDNPQGGTMPPRAVRDTAAPAAASTLSRDAQVFSILRDFAARRPSTTVTDQTKKMSRALEVERRMRDRLFTYANVTVDQALRSAETVVASADAETEVRNYIEKSRGTFVDIVSSLQETGWRALGSQVRERMAATQEARIERSWSFMLGRLVSTALQRLRSPSGASVDMGSVRTAQALAGGADEDDELFSGRAILSEDALDATGFVLGDRRQWVYGVSDNGFEPHQRLDGTFFESWASTELASDPGAFPFVAHLYPGDHVGCRCDWLPEILDPKAVNAPVRGNTSGVPLAASGGVTP
jgi:hypothetical protein